MQKENELNYAVLGYLLLLTVLVLVNFIKNKCVFEFVYLVALICCIFRFLVVTKR